MNWADSKHFPNSVNSSEEQDNTEPRLRNTREGVETRREAEPKYHCSDCSQDKEHDEFYLKDRNGRRDTTCKACRIIKQREKTLGVTQEEYLKMFKEQRGQCGICTRRMYTKRYKKLAVDHCHTTGRIRGLLCINCNTGLGQFKDDPIVLQRAIEWLKV